MADYKPKTFYGTAQTVFNSATDIGAGAFSGAGTEFDNTTDASVPYATNAVAMIEIPDWAAAPLAGTVVELWGLLTEVDGSSDDETDAPSGTASGGAHFLGAWVVAAADSGVQRREIVIDLTGVRKFTPYVKNGTGQNMNNDGGTNMVVKITPFVVGVTV